MTDTPSSPADMAATYTEWDQALYTLHAAMADSPGDIAALRRLIDAGVSARKAASAIAALAAAIPPLEPWQVVRPSTIAAMTAAGRRHR